MSNLKEILILQGIFYEMSKKVWPQVEWPQLPWLFKEVLDIEPELVALEPINKKGYHLLDRKNQTSVLRTYTGTQLQALREWWPLIPDYMKAD